ncbi:amino acid permease [Acidomonas methanolica]|nr:amino acid permease [Acidomonas methanolica]
MPAPAPTRASDLARTLHARHVAMISLGGVIGAGFFIGSGGAIALAGPGVIVTYLLAGLMVVLINYMLRDIALSSPGHGSFISQIRHTLGRQPGFIAGWTYWVIWATTMAIEDMAGASLLAPYIPLPYPALEALVLAGMTGINLLSVRGYGEVEYWLSLLKIVAIVLFIAIGSYALLMGITITHHPLLADGFFPHGALALLGAVPTVVFSMAGTEVATVAALESSDPDGNIARVARSVALRVGGFYLLAVLVVLSLLSWRDMVPGQAPFLLVLNRLHIPFASVFMTAVIICAVLSTLNSGLYTASRVLHDMAVHGDAPRFFLPVTAKHRLPRRAVLACSGATALIAATAVVSPGVVFAFLVSVIGAFILFDYVLIVLARMRLCHRAPWQPWLTLALLCGVLLAMLSRADTRSELALSAGAIVVVLAAGRLLALRAPKGTR